MQINNLKIRFSKLYKKWQIVSPNNRVLEEFANLEDAKKCAKSIIDFVKIGGRVNQ